MSNNKFEYQGVHLWSLWIQICKQITCRRVYQLLSNRLNLHVPYLGLGNTKEILEYEGDKSEVKGFRTSSAGIYLLYGSIFLFTNQTKVVFVPQSLSWESLWERKGRVSKQTQISCLRKLQFQGFKTKKNFMFEKITGAGLSLSVLTISCPQIHIMGKLSFAEYRILDIDKTLVFQEYI